MTDNSDEKITALTVYRSGGVLLYPSDTLWALGCDARNESAVQKIIAIKKRDLSKSFIVLLDDAAKIDQYISNVPAIAYDLIEYAENPLTIVFEGASRLAQSVLGPGDSLAVRIVKSGFCHKLIHNLRGPLLSTSANLSGEKSPENLAQIDERLISACDFAFDQHDAHDMTGKASTIMKLSPNGQFTFLRR